MPLGLFIQMRTINKNVNFALKFQAVAAKMAKKFYFKDTFRRTL